MGAEWQAASRGGLLVRGERHQRARDPRRGAPGRPTFVRGPASAAPGALAPGATEAGGVALAGEVALAGGVASAGEVALAGEMALAGGVALAGVLPWVLSGRGEEGLRGQARRLREAMAGTPSSRRSTWGSR